VRQRITTVRKKLREEASKDQKRGNGGPSWTLRVDGKKEPNPKLLIVGEENALPNPTQREGAKGEK